MGRVQRKEEQRAGRLGKVLLLDSIPFASVGGKSLVEEIRCSRMKSWPLDRRAGGRLTTGGQRFEYHEVQRLLAVQCFQAGDQGEPLGVGGTSTLEGATEKLDVLAQGELPTSGRRCDPGNETDGL